VAIFALDANQGSGLASNYGYLVHAAPTATGASIVGALIRHPSLALRTLWHRLAGIGRVLGDAGVVGVLSPWGFFVVAGTLIPAALNVNPEFISPIAAFQTLVVVPLVLVGSVIVLCRIGSDRPLGIGRRALGASLRVRRGGAWLAAAGLVALSLAQNVPLLTQLRVDWWRVSAPAAATLSQALSRVPADAEVVASQGVIGRFAERTDLYTDVASPQAFPVRAPTVVFVLSARAGIESVSPAAEQRDVEALRSLGARTLASGHGVHALVWHPPKGTHQIVLP
jgi:Predicted membrane protein (DUF2079)